jgi:ribosomal small subunit protein bTHX
MGKGDRRSRRGKLFRGSHGKRRPQKMKKAGTAANAEPKAEAKPKTPAS